MFKESEVPSTSVPPSKIFDQYWPIIMKSNPRHPTAFDSSRGPWMWWTWCAAWCSPATLRHADTRWRGTWNRKTYVRTAWCPSSMRVRNRLPIFCKLFITLPTLLPTYNPDYPCFLPSDISLRSRHCKEPPPHWAAGDTSKLQRLPGSKQFKKC